MMMEDIYIYICVIVCKCGVLPKHHGYYTKNTHNLQTLSVHNPLPLPIPHTPPLLPPLMTYLLFLT